MNSTKEICLLLSDTKYIKISSEKISEYTIKSYEDLELHFGSNLQGFKTLIDYNISLRLNEENIYQNPFSKGIDRLKCWLFLAYNEPPVFWNDYLFTFYDINFESLQNLNPEIRYYILSALIIYFQVFGDGNHRTAYKFFEINTGRELNKKEKSNIQTIHYEADYFAIISKNNINEIIIKLIHSYMFW
jgi:hypothetical protein